MKEFVALRPKTYSYLTDDNGENKKGESTKKYVLKRKLENYKHCFEVTQTDNKINQLEKNKVDADSV